LTKVLIATYSEEQRPICNAKAEELRSHGINCEVYFKAPKLGKQIDYAAARGIPYVLFISPEDNSLEVKSLADKAQKKILNLKEWALNLQRQP